MAGIFNTNISDEIDAMLRENAERDFDCVLYAYIMQAWAAARDHRNASGTDKEMLQSLRAYKTMYDPEDMELLENPHEIYMGITNLKCRALQSWLRDILLPAEDKPWTLKPTPVPKLPSRLEEIVVNRLAMEFEAGGFEEDDLEDLASAAKMIALEHATDMANEATEGMESKIQDQLEEGNWRKAFDRFGTDLSIYPSAVMKGPVMRKHRKLVWEDGKTKEVHYTRLEMERLNPWDVYPSPNSTTPQDGTYIMHVARMSQTDLHECIGLYGFDEIAVRRTIADNPHGTTNWLNRNEHCMDTLEKLDSEAMAPDQTYHVLVYYGKIPGRTLLDHGIAIDDPHGTTEAEIWVCNGKVLRAITNPYPLGRRPLYTSTVQPEPGSFWGRSLPSLLRDVQRVANATARALVKNMGFSSGPIGEFDHDRLRDEEDISELQPYRLIAVDQDPYNGQGYAVRFHNVENVAHRLLAVYDRFSKEADDVSGIPAYALGQPQTAGAGRTLGGLTMLMGNAAKGVKRIVANTDIGVIEPVVEIYYYLNLLYSEDETIKADAQVMARGSAGLLQRELAQGRAIEVLQILTPYVQMGVVPPDAILLVLRDIVASMGYPADQLNLDDPKQLEMLAMAAAQVQPGAQLPDIGLNPALSPTAPGTPIPALDGRSQPPVDPATLEVVQPDA